MVFSICGMQSILFIRHVTCWKHFSCLFSYHSCGRVHSLLLDFYFGYTVFSCLSSQLVSNRYQKTFFIAQGSSGAAICQYRRTAIIILFVCDGWDGMAFTVIRRDHGNRMQVHGCIAVSSCGFTWTQSRFGATFYDPVAKFWAGTEHSECIDTFRSLVAQLL
jgi:hypothetical protein